MREVLPPTVLQSLLMMLAILYDPCLNTCPHITHDTHISLGPFGLASRGVLRSVVKLCLQVSIYKPGGAQLTQSLMKTAIEWARAKAAVLSSMIQ
jgi:hypothetical protein